MEVFPARLFPRGLLQRLLRRDRLEPVLTHPLDFSAYRGIIDDDLYQEVLERAGKLRGLRVGVVSATPYGGGVAEIMKSLIPLMKSIGLAVEWYVMPADEEFFQVTKKIHNGLQGAEVSLSDAEKATYLRQNEKTARSLGRLKMDVIEIHDPQPLAVARFTKLPPSLWRCHIDTSAPNPVVWDFIRPLIDSYQEIIFTTPQFVQGSLWLDRLNFIAPTIDPLTDKNKPMTAGQARAILRRFGLDTDRPIMTQVSRFDPWKDPVGVVDAYRLVRRKIPQVQLVLVGSMALDDPEGEAILNRVKDDAAGDPDIFILSNLTGVGEREVNAFQTASSVIVQKSLREGFGLTVTEAMWKGQPVVGGDVGGIKLQIRDGETGFLVNSVDECADRVTELLTDPGMSRRMGRAARDYVRKNFLHPRLMRDHLVLYQKLLGT